MIGWLHILILDIINSIQVLRFMLRIFKLKIENQINNKFMIVSIAVLLLVSIYSASVQFDNLTFSFKATKLPIYNNNSPLSDNCGKLVYKNGMLTHLNQQQLLQNWMVSDFSTTYNINNLTLLSNDSQREIDFDMDSRGAAAYFINNQTDSESVYLFNSLGLYFSNIINYNSSSNPRKIFFNNNISYLYYQSALCMVTNIQNYYSVIVTYDHTSETTKKYCIANPGQIQQIIPTPNFQYFIVINTRLKKFMYYNSNNFTYSLFNNEPTNQTICITFDQTGTISIFIYQQSGRVLALNHTNRIPSSIPNRYNCEVVSKFAFNASLVGGYPLSGNYLVIYNSSVTYAYNFKTSVYAILDSLGFTALGYVAASQQLYSCSNNLIQITSYTINNNTALPDSESPSNFIFTQRLIVDCLSITNSVADKIILFATSTPLAYYFLSMLNYFNFCSLYVLLNFAVPEHVNTKLIQLYNFINLNILSIVNKAPSIQPLSQQMIDSDKLLGFGLSSDIVYSDYMNLLLFFLNCFIFFIVKIIIRQAKIFQSLSISLQNHQAQILNGLLINLILPLTQPWLFILWGGVRNVVSKINQSFQYFFIYFCLVYIFIYGFYIFQVLLTKEKRRLITKINNQNKILETKIKIKSQIKISKNVLRIFFEHWFICLGNFIYPLLIVFNSPIYFLVGILIYNFLQIWVSFNGPSLNKKIMSLYPCIFHICFIIFYGITNSMILQYSQIVCLLTLLIGSAHYILSELFQISKIALKKIKKYIFRNSVSPDIQIQKQESKSRQQKMQSGEQQRKKQKNHINGLKNELKSQKFGFENLSKCNTINNQKHVKLKSAKCYIIVNKQKLTNHLIIGKTVNQQ